MRKLWMFLACAIAAQAAGTVTVTCTPVGQSPLYQITWSWVGDASTGTVPATGAACLQGINLMGFTVTQVETFPGSPAPTNNYSAKITTSAGTDIAAGTLINLSATTGQSFSINGPPVYGALTLSIAGQSVASAKGTVNLWVAPGNYAKHAGSGGTGGSVTGCTTSGSTGTIQAAAAAGACQSTSITDNGTVVSTTEPIQAGGAAATLGGASNPFQYVYLYGTGTFGANNFQITGAATAPRTVTIPDANSVTVQAASAVAHQWVTNIDTSGVQHQTQPACGDLSNSVASCSTDATNATNIASGTLGVARLPAPFTSGTASGNTSKFVTTTGTLTTGDCGKFDASGNLIDSGATCTGLASVASSDGSITPTTCTAGGACNIVVANTVAAPSPWSSSMTCAMGAPAYTCRPAAIAGNTTFTVSGLVTGKIYLIVLVHDATSNAYTITWPSSNPNFINFPNVWNEASDELEIAFTCDGSQNCHPFSTYLGVGNTGFGYAPERTAVSTTTAGFGAFSFDSSSHTLLYYANNVANRHAMPRVASGDQLAAGDCTNCTATVASGTGLALGTGAIASGTCATAVTATATGTATTNRIIYTPNADPTGVTGYAPSASGSLYIWAWPTTNTVNFKVCNNTAASITPSALSLNWAVY